MNAEVPGRQHLQQESSKAQSQGRMTQGKASWPRQQGCKGRRVQGRALPRPHRLAGHQLQQALALGHVPYQTLEAC